MKILCFLSVVFLLATVWIGSTAARPTLSEPRETVQSKETREHFPPRETLKSRQLVVNTNNVPTAATGLNGGNTPGIQSPLQSLNLLQQVTNSGNNPLSVAAELEAQNQEALQLQNQKQQQNMLAVVQTQQEQVATVQAAIANQSHMANGQQRPGVVPSTVVNPATQQLQQQLESQRQQLLLQQQLLQQQVKPETQQLSQQQILLAQLLKEPASKRPQLLEQIKQTQTKQEAELLMHPGSQQAIQSSAAMNQPSRSQQELQRYQTLIQLLTLANSANRNPTRLGYYPSSIRNQIASAGMFGDNSIMAAQMMQIQQAQQLQQLLLLERMQAQKMMLLQQQPLAMMNPLLF